MTMSIFTNSAHSTPEERQAYSPAVVALLGEQDPLAVLTAALEALPLATAGLSTTQLTTPEVQGKWSIRDVVQHLVDSEIVWSFRMRMVLAQDRPSLTPYDQDLWASRLHYDSVDTNDALAEFDVLRRANLRLLALTSPTDRTRVGLHAERGEESVERMMRLYAGHDLLHLQQIARIRALVA